MKPHLHTWFAAWNNIETLPTRWFCRCGEVRDLAEKEEAVNEEESWKTGEDAVGVLFKWLWDAEKGGVSDSKDAETGRDPQEGSQGSEVIPEAEIVEASR